MLLASGRVPKNCGWACKIVVSRTAVELPLIFFLTFLHDSLLYFLNAEMVRSCFSLALLKTTSLPRLLVFSRMLTGFRNGQERASGNF